MREHLPRLSGARVALLGAGVVVAACGLLLALLGVWTWPFALGAIGLAGVALLQLVLLLAVRRVHAQTHELRAMAEVRHAQAGPERHISHQTHEMVSGLATAAAQDRSEVAIALEQVRAKLDAQVAAVDAALQGRGDDFAQLEALIDLRGLVQPPVAMPASRGWAAAPTTLLTLVSTVLETRPRTVVECGSGASSVWIGHALRRLGTGRCVALEHDVEYASATRADIARHGLQDLVEVRLASITETEVDGERQSWYATEQLADLHEIGMVFVDGPPGDLGPLSRLPAVPLLKERCLPGALFLLDDADRPDEKAVIERWVAEHKLESVRRSSREKGWHLLALPAV